MYMTKTTSNNKTMRPDNNTLALDRTVLANERTCAAWIRTGLAFLASGLAVARLMLDSIPFWSIRLITAILFLASGTAFFLAAWRYNHLHVKLAKLDVRMVPAWVIKGLTGALSLSAIIALVVIWRMSK